MFASMLTLLSEDTLKGWSGTTIWKRFITAICKSSKKWHRFLSRWFAHLTQKLVGMELCKKKNWFTMTQCKCKYMIPRGIANFAKTMLNDLGRWFANNWSEIKIQSNIWQFSNWSLTKDTERRTTFGKMMVRQFTNFARGWYRTKNPWKGVEWQFANKLFEMLPCMNIIL